MGPVPVGTYVYRWVKDGMVIAQSATLTVADIPAVPVLTSLTPASVVAGTGAVTVHVGGSGFTPASVGQVNGTARPTTYVSASDLSIQFSAAEVSSAGTTYSVTVQTPAVGGLGGGTSSAQTLSVVVGPTLTPGQTTGAMGGPGGVVPGGHEWAERLCGLAVGDGDADVQCPGEHGDERDGDVPAGGDGAGAGGDVCVSVGEGRDGDCAERDADGGGHSGGASADESDAGECGGRDGGGDGACGREWVYDGVGGAGHWDGAHNDLCVGDGADDRADGGGGEQCGDDV